MSGNDRYPSLTTAEAFEAVQAQFCLLLSVAFRALRIRYVADGFGMLAARHDAEWARRHGETLRGRRSR